MDIKSQIQKDRIEALKAGQAERKASLDYILGEIQRKEKDPSASGDVATPTIVAYLKSLKDFIAIHGESRPTESAKYKSEIALLEGYLPKQLTNEELRREIDAQVATGQTKKGLIIKALKEKHGAAVDGRHATNMLDKMGIK